MAEPTTSVPISEETILQERRRSVCGESYDPEQDNDISNTFYDKSSEDREMINRVLKNVWLTKEMDLDQKEAIIDGMMLQSYKAGEVLYDVGEPAEKFYIVKNGKFEAYENKLLDPNLKDDGKPTPYNPSNNISLVKTFEKEDFFGEIALLYDPPRCLRVQASKSSDNSVYEIQRHLFRKLVIQRAFRKRKKYEEFVCKCSLFDHLSERERIKVVNALRTKCYADKEMIKPKGEQMTGMHFLLKGKVKIEYDEPKVVPSQPSTKKDPNTLVISPGQWIGELTLLMMEKIPSKTTCMSAQAVGNVTTGYMDAYDFEKILGKNSIQRNSKKYEDLVRVALAKPGY
ncbi:unnamed protein product [Gordionus sp. m RMFG-2023]|uniref:cAMP-dependent protein kinase type II regulatory subunit-like n=1 Tax=Gordionus sp. m RMFG-2023 TaxID=3053472 RepID=UPI0030E4FD38